MPEAEIYQFPSRDEDHTERLTHRPPFGYNHEGDALVVDGLGNQNSPNWMVDGMQLLDLFETSVENDGFGPRAYDAWMNYVSQLRSARRFGKFVMSEEEASNG